jgi:hypothetical protein
MNELEAMGLPAGMSRTVAKLTERQITEHGVRMTYTAVGVSPESFLLLLHEAHINFWASPAAAAAFPSLAIVALRLLSMHTTSCASERNWSLWGYIYSEARNRFERAGKLVYVERGLALSVQKKLVYSPNTAVLPSDGANHEWELCLQLLEDE